MRQSDKIRRYLLGGLPEEERAMLESRYVADERVFQKLVAGENDLIDCYARGLLSQAERTEFESRYCTTPERKARVQFAIALHQAGGRARHQAPGFFDRLVWPAMRALLGGSRSFAWAAAVAGTALAMYAGFWLQTRVRRGDIERAQTQTAGRRHESVPGQTAAAPSQPNQRTTGAGGNTKLVERRPNIAVLALVPGAHRGAGGAPPTLTLSAAVTSVEIRLRTEGVFPEYRAELQTAEGQDVGTFAHLQRETTREGPAVVIRLEPKVLQPADYVIRLFADSPAGAREEIDGYSFRIAEQPAK